jgi:hypothetical protein
MMPVKRPCLHGWHVACRACAAIADALDAQFQRDVFFGVYNARGYTPEEWAAKQRRDRDRRAAA